MLTSGRSQDAQNPYDMRVRVTTPAVNKPVTLEEVKQHLNIMTSGQDAYLVMLIDVATDIAEQYTGRKFITQTLTAYFDRNFAGNDPWWDGMVEGPSFAVNSVPSVYELPWLPLQEVVEIRTYTRGDVSAVYPDSKYRVDFVDQGLWGRVALKEGAVWPTNLRNINAHETEYKVGYGDDPADVPPAIRQGILQLIAYLWRNRGDCVGVNCVSKASDAANSLHLYKVERL